MDPVINRLMEERKKWLQDTPKGFSAKPLKNYDGTLNLLTWECVVPGPRRTRWEGQKYTFTITFDANRVNSPLTIRCTSPISHPNVCSYTGSICSSLRYIWPKCGLKQILYSLQSFLEHQHGGGLYKENRKDFNERVKNMKGDLEVICIDE